MIFELLSRRFYNLIMTREISAAPRRPTSFVEAIELLQKLTPPINEGESITFDGKIKSLKVPKVIADEAGISQEVNCTVIGDSIMGVALIMRSRNPLHRGHFGFYLQPTFDGDFSQLEIWQSPAQRPKRGQVYWGKELLDEKMAKPVSPRVSEALLDSLIRRTA